MEQEIRFCTSADGTRIAYATYGEPAARTLVYVQSFEFALEYAWNNPKNRAIHEGFASGRRLVTFDHRGVGSSQREVDDLAIPAQVADLAEVVGQLGLERFDLMASASGALPAAAYAAEHPERVGRLVLWHPLVRTSDAPILRPMINSIRADWSMARRGIAAAAFPTGPTDLQRWFSNMMRDSMTPEVYARHFEVIDEFDGRATLSNVQAPTLVLGVPDAQDIEIASVRAVGSLIPGARLVNLEGDVGMQFLEPSQLLAAIRNFLDKADGDSGTVEPQKATGLVSILLPTWSHRQLSRRPSATRRRRSWCAHPTPSSGRRSALMMALR